ncbi:hypothetical protein GCM10008139_15090 [Staphylococcus chromogenes]|nr:hypothetical protein GCM10008139_15090 [Staphylococcus chromogenes]
MKKDVVQLKTLFNGSNNCRHPIQKHTKKQVRCDADLLFYLGSILLTVGELFTSRYSHFKYNMAQISLKLQVQNL